MGDLKLRGLVARVGRLELLIARLRKVEQWSNMAECWQVDLCWTGETVMSITRASRRVKCEDAGDSRPCLKQRSLVDYCNVCSCDPAGRARDRSNVRAAARGPHTRQPCSTAEHNALATCPQECRVASRYWGHK